MKTKIVYCLVSDSKDFYYEQLLISLCSLRKYNPNVIVEVVVDEDTYATLVGKRTQIFNYATSIIPVEVPKELTKKQHSRFIKTSLRKHVLGDYLFIDTDTIICSSLAGIDTIQGDICATQEYNSLNHFTTKDPPMRNFALKVGLEKELEGEPYFNSGVMYVKDSPQAHLLYETWHSSWKETLSKGLCTDQTSLCWANKKVGHVIDFLDDSWNCLLKMYGIKNVDEAKIVHYAFEHKGTRHFSSMDCLFATLKKNEEITPIIDYLIENPSFFIINAKEENFFREAGDLYGFYVYHHSVFSFFLWQAQLIKSIKKIVQKLRIHG